MAAITGIVLKDHFPLGAGGSVPGGLYAEVWQVPASSDGDTQTLVSLFVTPLYVIGPVCHTAISGQNVAVTTIATVDGSNTSEVLVIGKRKPTNV